MFKSRLETINSEIINHTRELKMLMSGADGGNEKSNREKVVNAFGKYFGEKFDRVIDDNNETQLSLRSLFLDKCVDVGDREIYAFWFIHARTSIESSQPAEGFDFSNVGTHVRLETIKTDASWYIRCKRKADDPVTANKYYEIKIQFNNTADTDTEVRKFLDIYVNKEKLSEF
jgi:hypothetical protein